MLKIRVIPVLYLMNGLIVRSETFSDFKVIGSPYDQLSRLSEWLADELVYIDITRQGDYDLGRSDKKYQVENDIVALLRAISMHAFMPLTFGGRITGLKDIDDFIRNGADKVIINSAAWRTPGLVTAAARKYGSQAIMVGIDVRNEDGGHAMYVDQGRTRVDDDIAAYAQRVEALGAGEILVTSIDRDGTAEGYDVDAIRRISDAVSLPVIACGGVGMFGDFKTAIDDAKASAVAAGNIFHFTENAYKRAKSHLRDAGYPVRYPYPI